MFATFRHPAQAYRQIEVETGLQTADPHRLIVLLYDGAIGAIAQAKSALATRDTAAKGKAVTKAIQIVDEGLKAAVDARAGGEVAQNLRDLYDYMTRRLVEGNLANDARAFDEVSGLLADLRDTWQAIAPVEARTPTLQAVG